MGKLYSGRLSIEKAGLLLFFIVPTQIGGPLPAFPTHDAIEMTGSTVALDFAVSTAEEEAAVETGTLDSSVSTEGEEATTSGTTVSTVGTPGPGSRCA